MSSLKKWMGGALAVTAVAAMAMVIFAPKAVVVEVAAVREQPMEALIDADGRTRVRERYVVTMPVSGHVSRILLLEGEQVHAGDIVARIAPQPLDAPGTESARARLDAAMAQSRDAAARLALASAALERQRRELQRSERLLDAGAIAPRDLELTQFTMRSAEAEQAVAGERTQAAEADVRSARAALLVLGDGNHNEVVVRAPVSGHVLMVHERSARVAPAGTPLLEVGNPRTLEVVVDVLSSDASMIGAGDCVRFTTTGQGDTASAPIQGTVRVVAPSGFTKVSALGVDEQRVNVIVDLDHVIPGIGDGYRLDAHIVAWSSERATVVPASALVHDGNAWHAFVVREAKVWRRVVKVGHFNGVLAEVVSGLSTGDEVVMFPSAQVSEGVRVHVSRTR